MSENVTLLKFWCQKVLPLVYDDSLSYYEVLCKVAQKLNETVEFVNNALNQPIEDLVLEVMNRWLNDGTFEQLINQEIFGKIQADIAQLQTDMTSTVKSVSDLQSELTNFKNSINTQITEINQSINGLETLTTDHTSKINANTTIIGNLGTRTTNVEGRVTTIENKLSAPRVYLFIGDSYAQGWTPDGNVNGWPNRVRIYMGIDTAHFVSVYKAGVGFVATVDGENFQTLMENAPGDKSIITDIVVCGGYNDIGQTIATIVPKINAFMTSANTLYPNAQVHIGFIGWNSFLTSHANMNVAVTAYIEGASSYRAHYLNGVENILHRPNMMSSDNYHPNDIGQYYLGIYISNALQAGSANVNYYYLQAAFSAGTGITNLKGTIGSLMQNNMPMLLCSGISFNRNGLLACNGQVEIKIGTYYSSFFVGNPDALSNIHIPAIVGDATKFYMVDANIIIRNRTINVAFTGLKPDGSDFLNINITSVSIGPFTICQPALYA